MSDVFDIDWKLLDFARVQNEAPYVDQPPDSRLIFDEVPYQLLELDADVDVKVFDDVLQIRDSFLDVFSPASLDNCAALHFFRVSDEFLNFRNVFLRVKVVFIRDNPAEI